LSEGTLNQHGREFPYYIKALAMGLPAVMLGLQISGWIFFLHGAMQGHADFRQLYAAGYMVRSGHASELFDYAAQKHFQDTLASPEQIALPFIRPAYQALLFAPLSLFPYRVAYFLFLAINAGLLALSYRFLRPWMSNLVEVWEWLPIALLISFLPVGAALMQGQDSILLLALLSGAIAMLKMNSEFWAGILIGSALFKFQIAVPIGFLFLCWKRWQVFGGFAVASSALLMLSVCLTGLAQAKLYILSLFSMSTGLHSASNQLHYHQPTNLMMNLHGLIYGAFEGHLSPLAVVILTVFVSAILTLAVARLGLGMLGPDQLVLAIASAILVSFYIFIHDLAVLEIPILVTLNNTVADLEEVRKRHWLMPALCTTLFAAPALILTYAYLFTIPLFLFVFLRIRRSSRRMGVDLSGLN